MWSSRPTRLGLLQDDLADLLLALLGVLAEREGDVVEQVHRPEQRAVLEEHAELAADAVEVLLAHADDLLAVDPDLTGVGAQQPDDVLQQHRLAGARRAQDGGDLALRHVEGDVLEHRVRAEPTSSPLAAR